MRVAWETGIVWLLAFGVGLTCADLVRVDLSSPHLGMCSPESVSDAILGVRDRYCAVDRLENVDFFAGVTEGDEASLQKALNMVYRNGFQFVSVLFYASWCPFSQSCRPSFSTLSSLYPSIPHFAIKESSVRPSILSKYGVHGFPTLYLLNSTMRIRYHGSRTLGSLVAFYGDVTGMKTVSVDDLASLEKVGVGSNQEKQNNSDPESCPFSWARSPENIFQHETYLALATAFVLMRVSYYLWPALLACAQGAWRGHIRNTNLREHPLGYLNRAMQIFKSLKEPCRSGNLQGGARNAKAWASKSLASVSIGDSSSGRD